MEETKNSRRGVLICGAYGSGNAGDEAILSAIIGELRSIDPSIPITVLTRKPGPTAAAYGVDALHTFDVFGFLRVMRRVKLYINGGGSLIQDVTSSRSLWYYLFTLAAAKRLGCRVQMYGCGIGPVRRGFNRRLVRRVLDRYVDAVTLRESDSARLLELFGVTVPEISLASDPALTLTGAPAEEARAVMAEAGIGPEERCCCFCLRDWHGFRDKLPAVTHAARYVREKYGLRPLFLAINHMTDGPVGQDAAALLKDCGAAYLCRPLSTAQTIGLIAQTELLVSMRLHALIFAAGQGVPLVGLSYDPKVTAFLRCVNGGCAELPELDGELLCRLIDKALSAEDSARHVRDLLELERINVDTARRLLEE